MGNALDTVRASRYRRLALVAKNEAVAQLLNQLAAEAELGILCTADRRWRPPQTVTQPASQPHRSARSAYYNPGVFPW
jgi:hypothetical protein